MMQPIYVGHIIAGSVSLVSGYAALYATKGAPLHRRAGLVFVVAMLVMALGGFALAVIDDVAPGINVPAATITGYLVMTSFLAVRPATAWSRRALPALMLVGLSVGLASTSFGLEAIANGGRRNGMPAFPFFLFGVTGLLAALGDLRVMRLGPPTGRARLTRHLWRMTFALLVAALSFFLGQAQVFPAPLRIPALLASPVLAVLLTLLYWVWKVRIRGVVPLRARPSAAAGAR